MSACSYKNFPKIKLIKVAFEAFTAVKIRVLLVCNAVWCCGRIPKFQMHILPPPSETLVSYRNATRRHNLCSISAPHVVLGTASVVLI